MATMNMQQALAKMAANVAAPVKTAPSGQPKVAPAPGDSGNATSASGNPTVAPGPTAHSNATSASGKPKLDMAPEGGQKGKSDTGTLAQTKAASEGESCGDDKMPAKGKAPAKGKGKPDKDMLAQTKSAGFAMGLYKAAAAASAENIETVDAVAANSYLNMLDENSISPDVVMALAVLEDNGISISMPEDFTQKVASVREKVARFYYKEDEMAEGFKARDSRDTDAKARAKGTMWGLRGGAAGALLGAAIGAAAAGKGRRLGGAGSGFAPGLVAGSLLGMGSGFNHVKEKAYHDAARAAMNKNEGKKG